LSSQPKVAGALAEAAVAGVTSGMIVGLGTGRTAARAIAALAERVKEERLEIQCVPTSHAAETLARFHGLKLIDFAMIERVHYLFDGADEVDRDLRMMKGKGGAVTRERIVAHAADRRIYMVNESKLVEHLGQTSALAVDVMAFGLSSVRASLRNLGLNGVVRRTLDGHLFLTDNGSIVVDATLNGFDPNKTARDLDSTPGVIDHGLFLNEADEVLVETRDGIMKMHKGGRTGPWRP